MAAKRRYAVVFDVGCGDLKRLGRGSLKLKGVRHKGRSLDIEASFYWGAVFFLSWMILTN